MVLGRVKVDPGPIADGLHICTSSNLLQYSTLWTAVCIYIVLQTNFNETIHLYTTSLVLTIGPITFLLSIYHRQ